MPQLLTCPNRHHWDQTDPAAVLPITHGLCPVCGEPPVAGSPIDWESQASEAAVALPALLGGVLAAVVAEFLCHGGPVGLLVFFPTMLCLTWLGGQLYERRRRARLAEVARALGFVFLPAPAQARRAGLAMPPSLRRGPNARARNWTAGEYRGTGVVMLDGFFNVSCPKKKGYAAQTVVFFPDPVPGLPDFEFAPTRDRRRLWQRDLGQLLGFRPTDPFLHEPFGGHYGFTGDVETVRWAVLPALRDFLTLQPGWVLGACQGRLFLYRPGRRCRADAVPTLIAVAWRLREMLRP